MLGLLSMEAPLPHSVWTKSLIEWIVGTTFSWVPCYFHQHSFLLTDGGSHCSWLESWSQLSNLSSWLVALGGVHVPLSGLSALNLTSSDLTGFCVPDTVIETWVFGSNSYCRKITKPSRRRATMLTLLREVFKHSWWLCLTGLHLSLG